MTDIQHSFAEAELRLFQQLNHFGYRPAVVFDIGGSNGSWSDATSGVYPKARYEIFEPLADHLPLYREVMQANLNSHPNFTLHKIGLGETNGEQDMAIFENAVGSSFVEVENMKAYEEQLKADGHLAEIKTFPVRRLDDYVVEKALPQPNLVKMDVQGYELAIIRGGMEVLAKADIILLESWLYRGYGEGTPLLHELMEPLSSLGFNLTDFGDAYWGPGHKLISIDAFFMRDDFVQSIGEVTNQWSWKIWK